MRVVVVLLLVSCNQIYELESTKPRDAFEPFPDEDRDGIADDRDNCPKTPNADQVNTDGDVYGDACDGCPSCMPCANEENHDEDGDLVDDGCDNCPAQKNEDQANVDGDGVGDTCDPSNSIVHHRLLFDGFGTRKSTWLEGNARWDVDGDAILPMPELPTSSTYILASTIELPQSNWSIDVSVELQKASNAGAHVEKLNGGPGAFVHCEANASMTAFQLNNSNISDGMQFPLEPVMRLRLSTTGSIGAQVPSCEAIGIHRLDFPTGLNIRYPGRISLMASQPSRFRHVDVITD